MKINGFTCDGPSPEIVVIPKGEKEFVFEAKVVTTSEWAQFEELLPKPTPTSSITTKDGVKPNTNDPQYQKDIAFWTEAKTYYLFMISLSATKGLEWDSVELSDPSTWCNITKDLLASGFHDQEIGFLYDAAFTAQGLNAKKIEEATKSFLARRAATQ